jgi:1-acyl-sn-glycerol-3-phosphate acyltransferase
VTEDFDAWWRYGSILTMPLVRLVFRIRVEGLDHVPRSGPAILAFNHVSVLDGPVLAIETSFRRRRAVRFLIAAEIFTQRVVGWIVRSFHQIPIRRGAGDTGALDAAVGTVRAGALAAIAPEGRVNPDPDAGLQRIRSGCARVALPTGAPVVPVGIWGTQVRWPKTGPSRRRPLRPRLAVVFGPPIRPLPEEDIESFSARLREALEEQVRRARAAA